LLPVKIVKPSPSLRLWAIWLNQNASSTPVVAGAMATA
jgi:hypothetical protein